MHKKRVDIRNLCYEIQNYILKKFSSIVNNSAESVEYEEELAYEKF